MSGWRREVCDLCYRPVAYIPLQARYALDDADDAGEQTRVSCVVCAIRRYGVGMIAQIMMGQSNRD